ncbi:DciA family protein [Xanthobacter sp. V13C-7B]|uniref:DUF721 domain-containing protein n=2 Tax=Xanthobacter variabilis TaxID=3119932 RepID=UPI003726C3BC
MTTLMRRRKGAPRLTQRPFQKIHASSMSQSSSRPFRPRSARPLADFVAPTIADVCGKAGFSVVEVVTHWDEIVGPDLAPRSLPMKLQWARGSETEPATLVVRVEGAYAIEMQYAAAVVIERINSYFGWRCVGRITLRQGPVPPRHARPLAMPPPEPGTVNAVRQEMAREIGSFEDEALATSLARLGALVRRERRGLKRES